MYMGPNKSDDQVDKMKIFLQKIERQAAFAERVGRQGG